MYALIYRPRIRWVGENEGGEEDKLGWIEKEMNKKCYIKEVKDKEWGGNFTK
jgi:hypothetical protein